MPFSFEKSAMTWMTIAYPMAIGACVTMALIHLLTGLRRRPGAAHLLFALNAFVMAVYSCFELALTRADSPARTESLRCRPPSAISTGLL